MKKEDKTKLIDELTESIKNSKHFYLTDTSGLTVEDTNKLRSLCFRRNVNLQVVKNTLLKKAIERLGENYTPLVPVLHGPTSVMFSDVNNVPAKLIQEFRKKYPKPVLKGAFVEECCYLGEDQLTHLINVKSRDELLGDLVALLQSPARNVISALQSGSSKIAGIVKTLSEKK